MKKLLNPEILLNHLHHIVLATGVLFLLFCVVYYGVLVSVTAKIDGRDLAPGDIYPYLQQRYADPLDQKLRSNQIPEKLANLQPQNFNTQFRNALDQHIYPNATDRLPALVFSTPQNIQLPGDISILEKQYLIPNYPTIDPVIASTGQSNIDPTRIPDDRATIMTHIQPDNLLYSLRWVNVAGRINFAQLIEQLETVPPPTQLEIPATWWNAGLAVADLQLERQQLLPDGAWSEPLLIAPLPDRASFRQTLAAGDIDPLEYATEISAIRSSQLEILSPEFYPLTDESKPWLLPELPDPVFAPDPDAPTAGIDSLKTTIENTEKQIETAERRITNTQRSIDRLTNAGRQPSESLLRRLASEQRTAENLNTRLATLQRQLTQLTGNIANQQVKIFDDAMPTVWATDITAQPNTTYRYRLRAVFTNPLYAKTLPESQANLADSITVSGGWSNWSEPIDIPADRYLFLVSANKNANTGSVDLYKFHAGYWYKTTTNVAPGDLIGGPTNDYTPIDPNAPIAGTIDFSTDLIAVDFDFDYKTAPTTPIAANTLTARLICIDPQGRYAQRILKEDTAERNQLDEEIKPEEDPDEQFDPEGGGFTGEIE